MTAELYAYGPNGLLAVRDAVKNGKRYLNSFAWTLTPSFAGWWIKSRIHDGKVMDMRLKLAGSRTGWSSYLNGDVIRHAFIIDAFDRGIIAWAAIANAGISSSAVRDMMLGGREAVRSNTSPARYRASL